MGTSRRIVGCTNCHEHDSRTARPRNKTLFGPPNFLHKCEHGKRFLSHTLSLVKKRRLATHHSFKPPCRTRRIVICDVTTVQIQTSCAPAQPHMESTRHAFRTPCCHTYECAAADFSAGVKPPDEIGEHPGQTQIRLTNSREHNVSEQVYRKTAAVESMRRPCPTNLRQTCVSKTSKHQTHGGSHLQDTCCNPARIPCRAKVIQASVRCQRVSLPTLSAPVPSACQHRANVPPLLANRPKYFQRP